MVDDDSQATSLNGSDSSRDSCARDDRSGNGSDNCSGESNSLEHLEVEGIDSDKRTTIGCVAKEEPNREPERIDFWKRARHDLYTPTTTGEVSVVR